MPSLPLPTEAPRIWRARGPDRETCRHLAATLGLSPLVADLLVSRGLDTPEAALAFLEPTVDTLRDPFEMADMQRAADRLVRAVQDGEQVLIYGDADVDGLSGTALLMQFLRFLGADPVAYVPNRAYDAYSFNDKGHDAVIEAGAKVVVSVDNGTSSVAQVARLQAEGVDVIITDHHLPGDELPPAHAVVNPRRADCPYPFKGLAGVGVAFKLACAVAARLSESRRRSPEMMRFLGEAMAWVAMGTLADMVPLTDENRVLTARGLRAIPRATHPGLAALCKVSEIDPETFAADDVAFRLAPRLNAAARLGRSDISVDLVTTNDAARAKLLASSLDQLNRERQQTDRAMFAEVQELLPGLPRDEPVVLQNDHWSSGLLGLVASRIVGATARPALLVSWGRGSPAKGSCRSIVGFDLHAALAACDEHLESHGGHAMAAGFSVRREKFDAFRAAFVGEWRRTREAGLEVPPIDFDGELPLASITLKLMDQLERLAPFGTDNPGPVLGASGVTIASVRRMGQDGSHLALELAQGSTCLRAVSFGSGDLADHLGTGQMIDVLFRPRVNRFRGRARVELELVDLRDAQSAPGDTGAAARAAERASVRRAATTPVADDQHSAAEGSA